MTVVVDAKAASSTDSGTVDKMVDVVKVKRLDPSDSKQGAAS